MMNWTAALISMAWVAAGLLGAWLMRYPGDGFDERYVFSAILGPIALFIALIERYFD